MKVAGTIILFIVCVVLVTAAIGWRGRQQRTSKSDEGGQGYEWIIRSSIAPANPTLPLSKSLQAFNRPRTNGDSLPPSISAFLSTRFSSGRAGALRLNDSRLLLSDLGLEQARLYAVPTARGWICYATTNGIAACIPALSDGISWAVEGDRGNGTYVHGLVESGVDRIDVLIPGGADKAKLSNNAFYAELRTRDATDVLGLRILYSDGRSTQIKFN
jgi:hypothetical protein